MVAFKFPNVGKIDGLIQDHLFNGEVAYGYLRTDKGADTVLLQFAGLIETGMWLSFLWRYRYCNYHHLGDNHFQFAPSNRSQYLIPPRHHSHYQISH